MTKSSVFSKRKIFSRCRCGFFEDRIKQYEDLLKIEHNEDWWNQDMDIK